jgi:DNA-binding transcriptional MerR regulator
MTRMFQVGEFARLAGLSTKVLRDYDGLGLFRPAWVDEATGYRRYSAAQLPELRRIVALRELGLGLSAIRGLVVDGHDLRSALEARRAQLEAARCEIDGRLAALGITLGDLPQPGGGAATETQGDRSRRGRADPDRPADAPLDVVIRRVPAELVATMDVAEASGDVARAFYELERQIRDLGARAPRPPGVIATAEGTEIFVPVRRAVAGLRVTRLPAIRAATALHRGAYAGVAATQADLDRWMAGAGLEPVGPRRVLYLQFGGEVELRLPRAYLVARSSELVTELQVPIK